MISTIASKFKNYLNHYAKVKTRQALLTLDDRLLEQAGISPDLLRQGISQWPWLNDEVRNRQIIANSMLVNDKEPSSSLAQTVTAKVGMESALAESNISYPAGEYIVEETTHKAA